MKQVHEQSFTGGLKQDVDPFFQNPGTYRYARNGRLVNVRDITDSENGHSMAFSNAQGTLFQLDTGEGSSILHMTNARQGTVVFSVFGSSSEIGLWYFDEEINGIVTPGIYKVLYTDSYDPHLKNKPYVLRGFNKPSQDRLGWVASDRFDSEVVYENENTERIYWTNRRGARHVLNLRAAPRDPEDLTLFGAYPSYWSAHAFRERPDVVFPLIKLLGRGRGRLPSGVYQVCVQYRSRNGVRSAYSPITRKTFVTSEPLEAYKPDGTLDTVLTQAYRFNHHNRVMGASGIVTQESLKWELKDIDVRWSEVVVAVLYYETEGLPVTITALKPIPIAGTSLSNSSVVVEITQLDGEEITLSELSLRYDNVLRTGTLASNQNRLFDANLTRLKPFGADTSAISFSPVLKSMRADTTKEPLFAPVDNILTHRKDNDPLINSQILPDYIVGRAMFTGSQEQYTITDDYTNDKGQVWEWLHGSYFRGETEEFGIVLFDRTGQPMFAYPLPSFTFPEQFTSGPAGEKDYYSLTKKSGDGLFDLQIMGVSVSGIRLPLADLYDSEGRLNASGFMLVRRNRQRRLLHQGVVFPVCATEACTVESGRDNKPFALPLFNFFETNYTHRNRHQLPILTPCTSPNENIWRGTESLPYYLNYHSPDVLIEGSFLTPKPGDVLKHVGVAGQAYNQVSVPLLERISAFRATHDYTKSVNTFTSFPRFTDLISKGRPGLGSTSRITQAVLLNQGFGTTYEKFDKDNQNLTFETGTHPAFRTVGPATIYGDGLLQRNSVLIKTSEWESVDIAESLERPASWRIVNYMQTVPDSSPESEPYYACGHFQPITQGVLDSTKFIYDSVGNRTHFEFNEVELWGGDAYVNLFDFTRIYPFPSDACEQHDYSLSHIIPIESKYNLMLRPGRTFARSAVRPEEVSCNNTGEQFLNGVMHQQPEDWNYNRALLVNTTAITYAVQPRDYQAVSEDVSGFSWTPPKVPGQLLDTWRMRLAGDAGQGDSKMGAITKLIQSEAQGLYAWHTHGVELLPLEPMSLQSSDIGTIQISSGAVFHRGIPISRTYGTQHPESVWSHQGQMGAWDARMGVLLRHSSQGLDLLSQSENVSDLVEVLTLPLSAGSDTAMQNWSAVAGVDLENSEIWITLSKKTGVSHTLVYNTGLRAFTSEFDVTPGLYANRGRLLLSVRKDTLNWVWAHNRGDYGFFYGNYFPTLLHFVVNVQPTTNKTFQNGALNINKSGYRKVKGIVHSTPNGGTPQTHVLTPQTDDRFRFHNNIFSYPAHEWDWEGTKEVLRDHYQTVKIEITNDTDNVPVSLTSYRTTFRISE